MENLWNFAKDFLDCASKQANYWSFLGKRHFENGTLKFYPNGYFAFLQPGTSKLSVYSNNCRLKTARWRYQKMAMRHTRFTALKKTA